MSEQEFAVTPPSLGGASEVAAPVQGGASVMPSQADTSGPVTQIATPPPPPAPVQAATPPVDWTQDPKFREFQSRLDKAEADRKRLSQQLEQTMRDNQAQLRQVQESEFQRQYQMEWQAAPPERKAQVEQKYRDLKAQRDMQTQAGELETLRAAQAVSDLRFKALQGGVPLDVIAQELADAGSDPRAQANAMIELPFKWLQFQQSQRQQPAPQPQYAPQPGQYGYAPQPVYQQPQVQYQQPVQAQPPAPQEPLRQPAVPVARPGTVTPSEQRAWSLRNQAMDSGNWTDYNEYKKRMVREARNAAAGR